MSIDQCTWTLACSYIYNSTHDHPCLYLMIMIRHCSGLAGPQAASRPYNYGIDIYVYGSASFIDPWPDWVLCILRFFSMPGTAWYCSHHHHSHGMSAKFTRHRKLRIRSSGTKRTSHKVIKRVDAWKKLRAVRKKWRKHGNGGQHQGSRIESRRRTWNEMDRTTVSGKHQEDWRRDYVKAGKIKELPSGNES